MTRRRTHAYLVADTADPITDGDGVVWDAAGRGLRKAAAVTGAVGDRLDVYAAGLTVVRAANGPVKVLAPPQGDVFDGDGGTSMQWNDADSQIEILADGLYDGYGRVDWQEVADATPTQLHLLLESADTGALLTMSSAGKIAAATSSEGRFVAPVLLAAGELLDPKINRSGADSLTCTYIEFRLVRIA